MTWGPVQTAPMYLLIRADEDGNPIRVLGRSDVDRLLADPVSSYGVQRFETAEFLDRNHDPSYWPDGTAVLVRATVAVPEPVTTTWRIPE